MFNGKAAPLISLTFVCRIYRLRDTSSPCLMMNAFCASEKLLAFIRFRSSPIQESVAENSSFKRSSFQGSDQNFRPQCLDLPDSRNVGNG